ncbi:MAG: hypothetical protein WBA77_23615, partial [Microcoleaceae cyanobacterium]
MKFINVPSSLEVSLDSAAQVAEKLLKNLATAQHFSQVIATAFEEDVNTEKVEYLRKAWAAGDFSHLPEVEIRSSIDINRGAGAFSKNTNKIYLAEEYAVLHRNHTSAIADILLEETGHWVDAQINTEEAPGDEGAIFSALVRGKILDPYQLHELKTENDHATVILDGEEIEIEQAIVDFEGDIVEVDPLNLWQTNTKIAYSWGSSDSFLQIFEEEQDVTLSRDITLSNPQDWDQLNNLDFLSAGTTVDSHFLFFKNPTPGTERIVTATITFDQPIVGFMGDPQIINPTNDLFLSYSVQPLNNGGTLDVGAPSNDVVEILGENQNILQVTFENTSAVEPLRILTSSNAVIPEPTPEPTPTPNSDPIRIEAEDLILDNYNLESGDYASGGEFLRVGSNGDTGTATHTWNGLGGSYEL